METTGGILATGSGIGPSVGSPDSMECRSDAWGRGGDAILECPASGDDSTRPAVCSEDRILVSGILKRGPESALPTDPLEDHRGQLDPAEENS